jgi:beta propeller repeat protein
MEEPGVQVIRRTRSARRFNAFLLACALFVGSMAVSVPSLQAQVTDYRLELATTSSLGIGLSHLDASATVLVWEDRRAGNADVYALDLEDNREFRPDRTPGVRSQPAISGTRIVWVSGADPAKAQIAGTDIATGITFTVTDDPGPVEQPAIDGTLVAWREVRGDRGDIRAKDLTTGETFTITADDANQSAPRVLGDTIVWQDFRNGNWDLYQWNRTTRAVTSLAVTPDDEVDPVLNQQFIAFRRLRRSGGPPQLVLLDRRTGSETLVSEGHHIGRLAMSDRFLLWEDWRSGVPEIYGFDLEQRTEFALARSQRTVWPAVSTRAIAWITELPGGRGRVQALAIRPRLPSDPQDPPAVLSADRLYFPQTKHYLSGGFKRFWQTHGGERIFGYPLTEEFSVTDPSTGEQIVVQYFERVRLEYRPNAPEDQRIAIGRLGAELTADRAFAPVAPFPDSTDRRYFPETGHSIAYGFKEFWEKNGGLAIFGYPISEEFTENGRTVQYFERARFEYNPNATDEESRITLGLLGREALQRMGWLPRPPIDTTMLTR